MGSWLGRRWYGGWEPGEVAVRGAERHGGGAAAACSAVGYHLAVDVQVDWVWGIKKSVVTWAFVLSMRVSGAWGDWLGWRKAFEGKSQ